MRQPMTRITPIAVLIVGSLLGLKPLGAWPIDGPTPVRAAGASFSEPKGWSRLKSDKEKTKGWFISEDSTAKNLKAMIMVDVGRPTDKNLRATADSLAKAWGGKVLAEKTTLDGVEALRVRVEKAGTGLRPMEGVVAFKDGNIFLLMGGAIPGRSVIDQVEEVRKAWRWVE